MLAWISDPAMILNKSNRMWILFSDFCFHILYSLEHSAAFLCGIGRPGALWMNLFHCTYYEYTRWDYVDRIRSVQVQLQATLKLVVL